MRAALPVRAATRVRGSRSRAGAAVRAWVHAVGSARPARIAYELILVGLVAAGTAGTSIWLNHLPLYGGIAAGIGAAIVVPLRLVFPLGAFLAGAILGAATGGESILLLMALSAGAGYQLRKVWPTVLAFAAALALWLVSSFYWAEARDFSIVLWPIAAFLLFGVLPAVVGRVVAQRAALIRAMQDRNVQLHQQQAVVAQQARTRERTRIARDMHDSLGHQLTLISLYAGALATAPEPQRSEAVALLRSTSAAAMNELRLILGILHQDDAQVAVAKPLTSLNDLVEASRAAGAQVSVSIAGDPRPLAPLIEHAAYRVIQEGLTNALRHARGAAVAVSLRYEPDALVAEVSNGPGERGDRVTTGQGLIGLTERVRLTGGVLYSGMSSDGGFRLAAILGYEPLAATGDRPMPMMTGATPGRPLAGDFAAPASRSPHTVKTVLIAVGVAVAGILGALVSVPFAVFPVPHPGRVTDETYRSVTVGDAERTVRDKLPSREYRIDTKGSRPVPANATCAEYAAGQRTDFEGALRDDRVYRFCFRDGRLVEKKLF